ncbi:MAG: hypothetical protein OSB70_03390 [Myxococcota bacterium]|nr:hypothetical protein [Myxococcota bacterium]
MPPSRGWPGSWAVAGLLLILVAVPAQAIDRGADGEFSKRDSSHFVLFQDVDIDQTSGLRGSRRFEQDVLETLEGAYQRADRQLGLRPQRDITVIVYDPAVFDAQFSGLFKFPAAGFYGGQIQVRGGERVSSSLIQVLHHEHVHAAFDLDVSGLTLPAWFNEGIAEWFEAGALGRSTLSRAEARRVSEAAAEGRLFSLSELSKPTFGRMGPGSARLAYAESHAFIDYLVDVHGAQKLREWIQAVVRTRDVERSARRTYRAELSILEERFRERWAPGG